jgi:hypothetical protein
MDRKPRQRDATDIGKRHGIVARVDLAKPFLQDVRGLWPERNRAFLAPLPLQLDVAGGLEGDVPLAQRGNL